jgi:hypothetical protein
MDEHYRAIQDLCSTHYHDNVINGTVRDEIFHHLIRTRHPESATELIVNRLTVESRIEVLADILLVGQLMVEGVMTRDNQILACLDTFVQSDRILGGFISNPMTNAQREEIIGILIKELNLKAKNMENDPSFDEIEEQIKRLQDKSVYSYHTLLELSVGSRRARFMKQPEMEEISDRLKAMVKITIDSFKLYRS